MQRRFPSRVIVGSPYEVTVPTENSSATIASPLPENSVEWTQVSVWNNGSLDRHQDTLAVEEPLEIRLGEMPLTVTMRTPGHDLDLAAGFLLTEGVIDRHEEIAELISTRIQGAPHNNSVQVHLRDQSRSVTEDLHRNFLAASSCGVCGKASIEAIRRRGLRAMSNGFLVNPELLCQLPEQLSAAQTIFSKTGGLHAAALFDHAGEMLVLREDIGRHNAVDKVIGWAMRNAQLPLDRCILLVSGRCGFEIAQKALAASIPVLASVSAPSSLAVKLARELGLTLVGFLRDRRFVLYANPQRCRVIS